MWENNALYLAAVNSQTCDVFMCVLGSTHAPSAKIMMLFGYHEGKGCASSGCLVAWGRGFCPIPPPFFL